MLVKCIAAYIHLSSTVYEYSEILVGNCNFFLPPCICCECSHWNSGKKFGPQKTRIMGYQAVRQFDDRLNRFDTIPACDGQTDRRPAYINNVCSMTHHHHHQSEPVSDVAVPVSVRQVVLFCALRSPDARPILRKSNITPIPKIPKIGLFRSPSSYA